MYIGVHIQGTATSSTSMPSTGSSSTSSSSTSMSSSSSSTSWTSTSASNTTTMTETTMTTFTISSLIGFNVFLDMIWLVVPGTIFAPSYYFSQTLPTTKMKKGFSRHRFIWLLCSNLSFSIQQRDDDHKSQTQKFWDGWCLFSPTRSTSFTSLTSTTNVTTPVTTTTSVSKTTSFTTSVSKTTSFTTTRSTTSLSATSWWFQFFYFHSQR